MNDKEFQFFQQYIQQNNDEMRHLENLREKVSSIILSLALLITGFIIQQKLDDYTIILSVLLIILGVFGAFMNKKIYSIHQFCQYRNNELYEYFKASFPEQKIFEYRDIADEKTKKRFPILSKLPHSLFWFILDIIISIIGIILLILTILK